MADVKKVRKGHSTSVNIGVDLIDELINTFRVHRIVATKLAKFIEARDVRVSADTTLGLVDWANRLEQELRDKFDRLHAEDERRVTEAESHKLRLAHLYEDSLRELRESELDPTKVTKLASRVSAIKLFEKFLVERRAKSLAVIYFDVHSFKIYNDQFKDHDLGDSALRTVAEISERFIRSGSTFIFRWGGDEFLGLMLDIDPTTAFRIAERLEEAIDKYPSWKEVDVRLADNPPKIDVAVVSFLMGTIDERTSYGVTKLWGDLIKRADGLMYDAKEGRRHSKKGVIKHLALKLEGGQLVEAKTV